MAYAQQPQVIEVVEYVDDDDWDGDDSDFEEVVEYVEQVVTIPKKKISPVAAYEVGIGAPPPLFLTPKEKAMLAAKEAASASAGTRTNGNSNNNNNKATQGGGVKFQQSAVSPKSPRVVSPRKSCMSKRISTKRHMSIVNQALGLQIDDDLSDYDEEEIIEEEDEEEIIEEEEEEEYEEEYYDDEEEIIEEEYYDDDEYEEIEIVETEHEMKERQQLEQEIAQIEQQMEEAKLAKAKRLAEGGEGETSKEKAQRMAHNSRLQVCKQMKVESDFKKKAAARAKVLAEREQNWGKKGKKNRQKDLSEIIAAKAKKQKKILMKVKSRDPKKPKQPTTEAPKVEQKQPEVKTPVEENKHLSLSDMLTLKKERGKDGMPEKKAKAPAEIQPAPDDDYGDDDLRAEDFLPSDEEEEEEEPVLSPEEERRKKLEWQKPTWTQARLKTTVKGTQVKKGKTLAAPITFIPKKINEGLEEEEDNTPSAGALMKGAVAMVQLPRAKKHQAGLKFTGNGARIRDGRKIEKPINTNARNKEEVKIWGADPDELKLTPRGMGARKGKILSDDNITQATQLKKYQFEKPAWATTKPEYLLKTTETGEHLKVGEDIAPKITTATVEKKYQFEKPSWTKAALKSTDKGDKLKQGEYLSAPIVDLGKKSMNINLEANPAFLRMTDQGERLMEEGNLAAPITEAPQLAKRH